MGSAAISGGAASASSSSSGCLVPAIIYQKNRNIVAMRNTLTQSALKAALPVIWIPDRMALVIVMDLKRSTADIAASCK